MVRRLKRGAVIVAAVGVGSCIGLVLVAPAARAGSYAYCTPDLAGTGTECVPLPPTVGAPSVSVIMAVLHEVGPGNPACDTAGEQDVPLAAGYDLIACYRAPTGGAGVRTRVLWLRSPDGGKVVVLTENSWDPTPSCRSEDVVVGADEYAPAALWSALFPDQFPGELGYTFTTCS